MGCVSPSWLTTQPLLMVNSGVTGSPCAYICIEVSRLLLGRLFCSHVGKGRFAWATRAHGNPQEPMTDRYIYICMQCIYIYMNLYSMPRSKLAVSRGTKSLGSPWSDICHMLARNHIQSVSQSLRESNPQDPYALHLLRVLPVL